MSIEDVQRSRRADSKWQIVPLALLMNDERYLSAAKT